MITERVGVLEAIFMFFGSFWKDHPVIFQGDPLASKRVVVLFPGLCFFGPLSASEGSSEALQGSVTGLESLMRPIRALQGPNGHGAS